MDRDATSRDLELTPEEMRSLGYHVVDAMVEHLRTLGDSPIRAAAPRIRAVGTEPPPLPSHPEDARAVVDEAVKHVLNSIVSVSHPRFFAFVPSPNNVISILADALVSTFNPFCGSWLVAPGPAEVELVTIDWLRQICGLPDSAGGLLVSGGSVANLTALAVARHVNLDDDCSGACVYLSDQAHASVVKALYLLGLRDDAIRVIPSDAAYRLEAHAVREAVARDRAAGLRPFCVIANAGTTNTGAVDRLDEIADLCAAESLWFHVDGAYGAPAVLTARGSEILRGLDRADSLVLDPHKWLFQPFEIGCVLVRDMRLLSDTFAVHPEYLRDVDRNLDEINFRDYGIQLTRSFRALKLWMSLKVFGLNAFRDAVQRGIELAEQTEDMLRTSARWEVVTPAQLGIVTFRFVGSGGTAEEIDQVNERIVERMMQDGFAFLTSTVLRGRVVLRLCTINPRTTDRDVEETVQRLEFYGSV